MSDDAIVLVRVMVENEKYTPEKKNHGDAGFDLKSTKDICIRHGEVCKIPTGVRMEIPEGYVGKVYGRSGLAAKGISVHTGIVDSGYRGEICAILFNHTGDDFHIASESRIAQILIEKSPNIHLQIVNTLSESERGEKGFGSSGLK